VSSTLARLGQREGHETSPLPPGVARADQVSLVRHMRGVGRGSEWFVAKVRQRTLERLERQLNEQRLPIRVATGSRGTAAKLRKAKRSRLKRRRVGRKKEEILRLIQLKDVVAEELRLAKLSRLAKDKERREEYERKIRRGGRVWSEPEYFGVDGGQQVYIRRELGRSSSGGPIREGVDFKWVMRGGVRVRVKIPPAELPPVVQPVQQRVEPLPNPTLAFLSDQSRWAAIAARGRRKKP